MKKLDIVEKLREKELQLKRIVKILSENEFGTDEYLDNFIEINNQW